MNPIYVHDCEECTYIKSGQYENRMVDWYVCGPTNEVVIWRFGNEPQENGSVNFEKVPCSIKEVYKDVYAILEEYETNYPRK